MQHGVSTLMRLNYQDLYSVSLSQCHCAVTHTHYCSAKCRFRQRKFSNGVACRTSYHLPYQCTSSQFLSDDLSLISLSFGFPELDIHSRPPSCLKMSANERLTNQIFRESAKLLHIFSLASLLVATTENKMAVTGA